VQLSPSPNIKERGAYYTDLKIARFLTKWALSNQNNVVLDPSFGGGVFLQAALERLNNLGNTRAERNVFGIELEDQVHKETLQLLKLQNGFVDSNLSQANFFEVDPYPKFHAIVGNPPFIRFQSQDKAAKKKALDRAADQAVTLTEQVNLWVPFIVHSTSFLKDAGRIAMVVPAEIGFASYSKPLLTFLAEHFQTTTFITFASALFPEINQDVILLLADKKKAKSCKQSHFYILDAESKDLDTLDLSKAERVEPTSFIEQSSFAYYWLPNKVRSLYDGLLQSKDVTTLKDFAKVSSGYVTGANQFFHLNEQKKQTFNIDSPWLSKSVYRANSLKGLGFTQQDWHEAEKQGKAGYLLNTGSRTELPKSVERYLEDGKKARVHQAYKCRSRQPWYRVPSVRIPDAFLSYMSGGKIQIIANEANLTAPNSLHHITLHPNSLVTVKQLCIAWQSTLSQLSSELNGRPLGGGMLKLEPSEAARVAILRNTDETLFEAMDKHMRAKQYAAVRDLADRNLETLLSKEDICLLREGAEKLQKRRRKLKN